MAIKIVFKSNGSLHFRLKTIFVSYFIFNARSSDVLMQGFDIYYFLVDDFLPRYPVLGGVFNRVSANTTYFSTQVYKSLTPINSRGQWASHISPCPYKNADPSKLKYEMSVLKQAVPNFQVCKFKFKNSTNKKTNEREL